MKEEIKEMVIQVKEILNKYPEKQLEILEYLFGKDYLMKIINKPTYEQLETNWKELKKWLKEQDETIYKLGQKQVITKYPEILNKMQEIESGKNE